jgi:tRNA A-37 threonylcarbamoyl transferase component Bud32/Skp family chaperone for outer membrane proteins
MMDLHGRILDGRYQLGSLLGAGGMARVYRASDRVLERQVAVKVLSPPYVQDPSFVERFRREARSAARLSHPNIVAVFDSGSDAGEHYLVMEYVAGQSLAELLARQGRLAPRRAAELAMEVCAALAAAHAQGLVHRDVKPANVLVGDDGRVKVTDFGIAKAAATATLTGTGTVLGTAAYLSPEQAQGGSVDARSDLYSLGCVLYELLCGSPPFGSGADGPPVAVATRHLHQPPEPPSARTPQVDPSLDAVVLTALAKDPARRYQSAVELQDALERVLAGDAIAAGLGSPEAVAAPTEQLPGLPGRTGVLPAATGPAVRDSGRRPGWPRWALVAAGIALGFGLVVALLWPDGGTTPARREAGPTASLATSASSTTTPSAPSASGVQAALANLTAVITAARQQGTVDQEAEDLLHQADDLANALQENPKDRAKDDGKDEDEDEGGGNGKGEDAAKKVTELERKVDELIGKGKIRPPATTQIRQAVAQLTQALQQAG